jgi:hypothetical protein
VLAGGGVVARWEAQRPFPLIVRLPSKTQMATSGLTPGPRELINVDGGSFGDELAGLQAVLAGLPNDDRHKRISDAGGPLPLRRAEQAWPRRPTARPRLAHCGSGRRQAQTLSFPVVVATHPLSSTGSGS